MYMYMYMYIYIVHVHTVTIRRRALILLYMPKFKAELINANTKFKNERRILIGYWLAQQLLAARDVHCTVHVQHACACSVQCVILCNIRSVDLRTKDGYQPNFHTKCMHFGW